MKKQILFVSIGIALFIVVVFVGYYYIMSLANVIDDLPQGADAVNAMSEVERAYYENTLELLERGMSEADVIALLGEPAKRGNEVSGRIIHEYACPVPQDSCLIRVKIENDSIYAIEWLKLESFYFEKEFSS